MSNIKFTDEVKIYDITYNDAGDRIKTLSGTYYALTDDAYSFSHDSYMDGNYQTFNIWINCCVGNLSGKIAELNGEEYLITATRPTGSLFYGTPDVTEATLTHRNGN